MKTWQAQARMTAAVSVLLLSLPLVLPATSQSKAAEDCPFAGTRPPLDEILTRPPTERPPLCKADLTRAELIRANLTGANLTGANLFAANLTEANLFQAKLTGANLTEANFFRANLTGAGLLRANLTGANLTGANLTGANLTGAGLLLANLTGANLFRANLSGADLPFANLHSAIFEPDPGSLSSVTRIEFATNLSRLIFRDSDVSLVVLRKRFADLGLRRQEREVTFAKSRAQQVNGWHADSIWSKIDAGFSYLAFDLTCGYGLYTGKLLKVLGASILFMALIYALALRSHGNGALWRVWLPDRVRKGEGQTEPERLWWERAKWSGGPPRGFVFRLCRALALGLLFSLVSSFQIGWRELNVGNWITRLQPREYTLRATGWVRVVSGAQSLLSVYLLALWVLSYFGRPFE